MDASCQLNLQLAHQIIYKFRETRCDLRLAPRPPRLAPFFPRTATAWAGFVVPAGGEEGAEHSDGVAELRSSENAFDMPWILNSAEIFYGVSGGLVGL